MNVFTGVIYVDVDDTLIDAYERPKKHVLAYLKDAKKNGSKLYLWSQGGEEYCERIAQKLGIRDWFHACLDKPDTCIDDLQIEAPFIYQWIHPIQLVGLNFDQE